jgi:hypothetical protein
MHELHIGISLDASDGVLLYTIRNQTGHALRLRRLIGSLDVVVHHHLKPEIKAEYYLHSPCVTTTSFLLGPDAEYQDSIRIRDEFVFHEAGEYDVWIDYAAGSPGFIDTENQSLSPVHATSNVVVLPIDDTIVKPAMALGNRAKFEDYLRRRATKRWWMFWKRPQ